MSQWTWGLGGGKLYSGLRSSVLPLLFASSSHHPYFIITATTIIHYVILFLLSPPFAMAQLKSDEQGAELDVVENPRGSSFPSHFPL